MNNFAAGAGDQNRTRRSWDVLKFYLMQEASYEIVLSILQDDFCGSEVRSTEYFVVRFQLLKHDSPIRHSAFGGTRDNNAADKSEPTCRFPLGKPSASASSAPSPAEYGPDSQG